MGEVIPQAEVAYTKYGKDKGMKALIDWFRAELALQDSARQKAFSSNTDSQLEQFQNATESLAKGWREARLLSSLVALVA